MAHKKKIREIQSRNPSFSHLTRSLEHKNQGFVRQNFGYAKRAWIQEYKDILIETSLSHEKKLSSESCSMQYTICCMEYNFP